MAVDLTLTGAEVRALVELEKWRLKGLARGLTARAMAYDEEGGTKDGRGARNRMRTRLHRMRVRGLVASRHFIAGHPFALLGWYILPEGREALRAALRARCPYCRAVRAEGEAYPYPHGHHKMSCHATRELEERLGCFGVPTGGEATP